MNPSSSAGSQSSFIKDLASSLVNSRISLPQMRRGIPQAREDLDREVGPLTRALTSHQHGLQPRILGPLDVCRAIVQEHRGARALLADPAEGVLEGPPVRLAENLAHELRALRVPG